jgi:hypothetical protein
VDFDVIACRAQSLGNIFRGVFRCASARKQLGLHVVYMDCPGFAKGFNNDGSHRIISSED